MHEQVSHGARSREQIAPNVYRRTTKDGVVRFEVMFRDVDGRQRARRLAATSERAAIREARAILADRDGGERIVAAEITVDAFAEQEYFPTLEGLVAAGRRAERGRDRYAPRPAGTTTATSSPRWARCGSARSRRET
jgi:hypothetical protein